MRFPRMPQGQTLHRLRTAALGLFAGVVGMLAVAALSTVVYSGRGLWAGPAVPTQVYADF